MSKKSFIIISVFLLACVSCLFYQPRVTRLLASGEYLYGKIKTFTSILETIQRAYVEERDADELIEDAIKGMLSNLDPHTSYLSEGNFKTWNESFEGYSGIGISYDIIRDKITVLSVLDDGPAAKIGLRPGDKIISINNEPAVGLKRDDAALKLKGASGTDVAITVERDGWENTRSFKISRKRIILDSITQTLMLTPTTGYIKLERFSTTTPSELDQALTRLERLGMKDLILDLRGNSGGYLNSAIEVADKFIQGGQKILVTKGRLPSSYQEFYSTSENTHPLYPLIVLVDHGSASAAEIVAGAVQDLDRGLLVGKTTFGKGLVQSQYRFQDGSALLITTARYYTPSGRPIQRDYYNKSKEEYYGDAYDDDLRFQRELNEPTYKTVTGRKVHAGNGIRPDIWVENSENIMSDQVRRLFFSDKRYFYLFAEDYIKKHPSVAADRDRFIQAVRIAEDDFQEFVKLVEHGEPGISRAGLVSDKTTIKFIIKRELAYLLWGSEARFKINIVRDKQLQEALQHFDEAKNLVQVAASDLVRREH